LTAGSLKPGDRPGRSDMRVIGVRCSDRGFEAQRLQESLFGYNRAA
jgi:hypothetical protein